MSNVTLEDLKKNTAVAVQTSTAPVAAGFDTVDGFVALQRMATLFNSSSIVPVQFQGRENLGNAAIAIDMAIRMKANPLMVMQNLFVVYGRPSWSAQFLIATLNKSGRFSALRYEFQGTEGKDDWGCRAVAVELATGQKLEGPLVTIGLAKREGWYDRTSKNGQVASKWPTMPELMLRYRAASWFVRSYAPEIAMGLPETDELRDTYDVSPALQEMPVETEEKPEITVADIEKKSRRGRPRKEAVNAETGEVQPEPVPSPEPDGDMPTPEEIAEIRAMERKQADWENQDRNFYGD